MSGAPGSVANGQARLFLPRIESLRGFAALCVAYYHCSVPLAFSPDRLPEAYQRAVRAFVLDPLGWAINGQAAVIVFFVISGLVLSLGLDRRLAHRSVAAYGAFVWRRGLRIYPAHIAALLLIVPLAYLTVFRMDMIDPARFAATAEGSNPWINGAVYGHLNPGAWLRTAILWDNYYNPVTWTLRVEILGSLLLPLFAVISRAGRLRTDLLVLAALAALTLLIDAGKRPDFFTLYLPAFYLGCMVRTHGRRLAAAMARIPHGEAFGLAGFFLLLVGPSALVGPYSAVRAIIFGMSAAAFGLVSLVAWGSGRRAGAVLLHPLSRRVGRLSYSFYLWHALIMYCFARLLFALVAPEILARSTLALLLAAIVVTVPLALAVAALSYRWIERPFIALGRRWGSDKGEGDAGRLGPIAAATARE